MRPPGYEPGELPTAPLRDVNNTLERGLLSKSAAKVRLFSELCKCFCENYTKKYLFALFLPKSLVIPKVFLTFAHDKHDVQQQLTGG